MIPRTPRTVSSVAGWHGAAIVSVFWTLKRVSVSGQDRYGGPGGYLETDAAGVTPPTSNAIPIQRAIRRVMAVPRFSTRPRAWNPGGGKARSGAPSEGGRVEGNPRARSS